MKSGLNLALDYALALSVFSGVGGVFQFVFQQVFAQINMSGL